LTLPVDQIPKIGQISLTMGN